MKPTSCLILVVALFAACVTSTIVRAEAPPAAAVSIPLEQLGAEAQKQYKGDGIGIVATPEGALIKAQLQALEGEATPEGLWLRSTAEEGADKSERFMVRAMSLGCGVESPGAQAVRGAPKISTDAIAEFGSALYDGKIPRREVVPVKWTRGCFIDPAESSHVAWDRGKRAASNHLELLDEDSRSPARLSSPGRCRDGVAAPASSDKKTGRRDHDRSAARLLSPSRGACLLSPAASAGSSLPLRPGDLEHPLTTRL